VDSDIPLWVEFGIFSGCTLYALLLSGAEAAFSTLPRAAFQKRAEPHEGGQPHPLSRWLDNQERLFATLIVGKTVMLTGAAVSAAALVLTTPLTASPGPVWGVLFTTLGAAVYFLVAIEWLPRALVARYGETVARISTPLVRGTFWLLWPLVAPIMALSRRSEGQGLFSNCRNPHWLDEELHRVLELEEIHELQPDEKEMISSIIEMHETSVREVMVPRVDMVCAEANTDIPTLLALIREMGHSRIPIYRGSIDNIIGVVYAKDLLKYEESPEEAASIEALARSPYFVPETKKVDDLLREFQQEKIHLAIVVDEHGGIAGLVTLEDLLEEIVGEIQDEYDAEQPMYEALPDGSLLVDAKLNIDALNEIMHTEIVSEDFETIGGLIYAALDRVPEPGETIDYKDLRMVVREVEGQRIAKVAITRIEPVAKGE
jgi:CBS domain containing-hemolysin-like protein